MSDDIPVSTKWTLDAAGTLGRISIESVYMIVGNQNQSKGTGFLLNNGYIVTNNHVIQGNSTDNISGFSSSGNEIHFSKSITDPNRDLALLIPKETISGGLELGDDSNLNAGEMVSTWGFPLGYNGPPPLLSVGYLAGFKEEEVNSHLIKHLVVNGAFNPGNSGGPLFHSGNNQVIGIVVTKHAPLNRFQLSALQVLASNRTGVTFTTTDNNGNQTRFTESQLVADLLDHLRRLTQVMIGEAISVSELKSFLNENEVS